MPQLLLCVLLVHTWSSFCHSDGRGAPNRRQTPSWAQNIPASTSLWLPWSVHNPQHDLVNLKILPFKTKQRNGRKSAWLNAPREEYWRKWNSLERVRFGSVWPQQPTTTRCWSSQTCCFSDLFGGRVLEPLITGTLDLYPYRGHGGPNLGPHWPEQHRSPKWESSAIATAME